MLRMLNAGEVEQVAGGIIWYGPVEIHPSDPNMPPIWVDWSAADGPCGPYESEYLVCGDAIIINGDWRTLDAGDNREFRLYPDGTQALYENDRFVSLVNLEPSSVTNGSASVSVEFSRTGAGGSYTSNDGATYNFTFLPGI